VVYGEPFSPERHPVLGEVKAVTYHQASVERTGSGWRGRFILDV
jgi:SHS2 domain-containing protein